MIKSCKDCSGVCCKTGPGPHEAIPPHDYLGSFGGTYVYNKKCDRLSDDNKCGLWGTKDFPEECRVYVCQNRQFTKRELHLIDNVVNIECENCGCEWGIGEYKDDGDIYVNSCEVCGWKNTWLNDRCQSKPGKKSMALEIIE